MTAVVQRVEDNAPVMLLIAANVLLAVVAVAGLTAFVVAVALGVATTAAILSRPQRGILLFAALVPFDGLLFITPLKEYVSQWVEPLIILTLLCTFLAPPSARGPKGRRLPRWLPALFGLLVVSLLLSVNIGALQAIVGIKIAFFPALVCLILWRCPLSAKERDQLVTVLMVVGFITVLIAFWQQMMGHAYMRELGYRYDSVIRFSGDFMRSWSSFRQPFPFGFFLMAVILVGVPVALRDTTRLRNQLFLLALPLYSIGMLTSVVRGAWIGTAVGLTYLGFTKHRVLLAAAPLALLILVLFPAQTSSNALSSRSGEARASSWEENVDILVDNPLGLGPAATGAAKGKVLSLQGQSVVYQGDVDEPGAYQPDNYYVKTALELGIVGLWLFVLVFLAAMSSAHHVSRSAGGQDGELARGIAAFVLASIVASLVSTYLEIYPTNYFFWILVGVGATMDAHRHSEAQEGPEAPALGTTS